MIRSGNIITLLSLLVLLWGCTHSQSYNKHLITAEQYVDNAPDETIRRLADMPLHKAYTRANRALYALLLTESVQNAGGQMGDEAPIAMSEAFFDSIGDDRRHIRALLQHGILLYRKQQLQRSIPLLKQAENLADKIGDKVLRYQVYTTMAQINTDGNNLPVTLHYLERNIALAQSLNSPNKEVQTTCDLVAAYLQAGNVKEALRHAETALSKLVDVSKTLRTNIYTLLADCYMQQNDTAAADRYIAKAMNLEPGEQTLLLQAMRMDAKGNHKAAHNILLMLAESIDNNISIAALQQLLEHAYKDNNTRNALIYSTRLNALYKQRSNNNRALELLSLQKNFTQSQAEKAAQRRFTAFLGAVIAVLVLLSGTLLYQRWRMYRLTKLVDTLNNRYADDLQAYNNTMEELRLLQAEHHKGNRLVEEKAKEVEQLQQKLARYQEDQTAPGQWNMDEELFKAPVLQQLHYLAATGKHPEESVWNELLELVSLHDKQALAALTTIPSLTPRDLRACLLTRFRFLPSEIGVLLLISPQGVTNLRVRLLQRIFNEKGGAKTFDIRIREKQLCIVDTSSINGVTVSDKTES